MELYALEVYFVIKCLQTKYIQSHNVVKIGSIIVNDPALKLPGFIARRFLFADVGTPQ